MRFPKFLTSTFLLLALLPLCLLSSCGGSRGKELSEFPEASTGDSLLYYYIQLRALEYWDNARVDTMLRHPEQREKFLQGVEKGLSLVGDEEAYNRGLRLGVRLAYNLREFEQKYGVDLDDNIIAASLRNGLQDGKDIPALEDQKEFYRLLDKMKALLHDKMSGEALMDLSRQAEAHDLKKANDHLYYRILRPGQGREIQNGDVISVSVDYQRSDGDNLGLPSPIVVTVGDPGVPAVMDEAYRMLRQGTTAMFATTASDLFGTRTSIMGLQDDDVVVISLILNEIVNSSESNHPGAAVVPRQ